LQYLKNKKKPNRTLSSEYYYY